MCVHLWWLCELFFVLMSVRTAPVGVEEAVPIIEIHWIMMACSSYLGRLSSKCSVATGLGDGVFGILSREAGGCFHNPDGAAYVL